MRATGTDPQAVSADADLQVPAHALVLVLVVLLPEADSHMHQTLAFS
jgi:hypothetical protein